MLNAARRRLSAQLSDSLLTSFITLSDAIAALDEVGIAIRDISGDKERGSVDSELENSLEKEVSNTLLARTAYTEKINAGA